MGRGNRGRSVGHHHHHHHGGGTHRPSGPSMIMLERAAVDTIVVIERQGFS